MKVFKAPHKPTKDYYVFLAGSIEMGKAEEWQEKVTEELKHLDGICLFNPRRSDWNKEWEQSIDNPKFVEQVEWELDALDKADLIVYYFDPNTISPITLFELGRHAKENLEGKKDLIVYCPDGYFRKGNVDVVCRKHNIQQVHNLSSFVELVEKKFKTFNEKVF